MKIAKLEGRAPYKTQSAAGQKIMDKRDFRVLQRYAGLDFTEKAGMLFEAVIFMGLTIVFALMAFMYRSDTAGLYFMSGLTCVTSWLAICHTISLIRMMRVSRYLKEFRSKEEER